MTDLYAQIQSAANAGAFGLNGYALPTAANCRAGNYRKGRVKLYGFDIAIETPQGQCRMGKSDGRPWSVTCMAHYGDISGTRGADGDPVDCYIGPSPESNRVFVVNQNGKSGAFDEHKVMLAFADEDAARSAYMGSYEQGWTGLGSMVAATVSQFRWWLKYGDTRKPFTTNALPYDGDDDMTEITWDSAAMPANSDLATILYGLRLGDRDEGLLLDAVQMSDIMEDADGLEVFDALVVENVKLQLKMEQLQRIMEAAGDKVKPVALQISEPFKQKGTTNVTALFELSDGQTVAIFFHNPDSTPNKLLPQDELVSWKWLLNKKDVTILVAPEKGRDLNPREVARRVMRLAERNSDKFQKANGARAERLAGIEQGKQAVAAKESALASLDAEIAELTVKVEAKRANQAPLPGGEQGGTPPEGQGEVELPAESLADVARRLIPAEFETRDDAEGFTAIAADGYGIRLRPTAGGGMLSAYILKPGVNAQESMGSGTLANGVESAVRASVDTALMVISKWRAERVIDWTKAEELATNAAIRGLGVARINDIGSENVYVEKDGKPFMFKPGNTDAYAVGEHDFGQDETFAVEPEPAKREAPQLDAKAVADLVSKSIPFGALYSPSNYKKQVNGIALGLVKLGLREWQADSVITSVKTLAAQKSTGGVMMYMAPGQVLTVLRNNGWLAVTSELPAQSVESIAAQYAAELTDEEKATLLTGFMPERVTDAAQAAGVSPKAVLSAMQSIVEDGQESGSAEDQADAAEQAKYQPFDRSKVKMPSAVKLLLNQKGYPILIDYQGKDGWSNGHLLALSKPKLVTDAITKYHVDESLLRKLSEDAVSRVIPKDATVRLEPIADFSSEGTDMASLAKASRGALNGSSSSKDVKTIKYKAVVLANLTAGIGAQVDAGYFGYFDKTYKQPDYFMAASGTGSILVKKGGDIVGVIMPMRGAGDTLKRAAKAAGVEGEVSPAAADQNIGRKWINGLGEEVQIESLKDGRYITLKDGKVGGAPIIPAGELEQFIALDQRQYQDRLAREKANAEQEAEDAAMQARREDTDGYADQFPQVQRDRIRATLVRNYNTRKGLMSLRDFIRELVAEGRIVTERSGERVLIDPATEGFHNEKDLTKTGLDYAAYLIARRPAADEPQGDDQMQAARDLLQSVIDGSADMDEALADRLQAVHDQYESNAEIMELFEQAANAFSDAMIAKARAALAA